MKVIFNDPTFSFELLRAIGYAGYGGADIGECLSTANRTKEGDFESWWVQWNRTAERVRKIADECLSQGHTVSARQAYLRASNYYRAAEFFLHADPADSRILTTWRASQDCFRNAASLMVPRVEAVEIPYERTTLPGHFYRLDTSGTSRPTLIVCGGFDSILEELYFAAAAAALQHGYQCLTFEGPGQGRLIREQRIPFRPDWEKVVTPVVDWAVTRPEIDARRMVLLGMSQGGYFAPRAAAFEHRLAACIAWDGVFDVYEAILAQIPRLARDQVDHDHAPVLDALLQLRMHIDAGKRWAITNGMWTYGASSPREFIRMNRNYTLKGIADKITCPVLVCEAEKDQFFPGQPKQLYEALTGAKDFIRFTTEEGAEEHCHEGALTLFHQRMFDWLDTALPRTS